MNGARSNPAVLVLGFDVHGLAIARSLGRHGVRVEAVESEPSLPHVRSRYCRRLHVVADLESPALIDFLEQYGASHAPQRTALFITRDRIVPLVSAARARLAPYFLFNLPDDVMVSSMMDKERLPAFLERHQVNYPRTLAIDGPDVLALVPERLGFPCIVKPALRSHEFKAAIAPDPQALARIYADVAPSCPQVIAQQLIPGSDSDVYFCFVYCAADSRPRGAFIGRKLLQFPRGTGIAAQAEGCDDEFVREETLRIFRAAGYRGFGSSEFRLDPQTRQYYLIEFTVGRTDYNVGCAIANGVDLPYIGYCDLAGLPLPPGSPSHGNSVKWTESGRVIGAIMTAFPGTLTGRARALPAVVRALCTHSTYAVFDVGDPLPFLRLVVSRAYGALRRVAASVMSTVRGK